MIGFYDHTLLPKSYLQSVQHVPTVVTSQSLYCRTYILQVTLDGSSYVTSSVGLVIDDCKVSKPAIHVAIS